MSLRRMAALGLVLLLLGGLAACGGTGRRGPGAWAHLTVLPDGTGRLDLYAAGPLRSDAEVRALAEEMARETFPGARASRTRTLTDRGEPFARVDVDGVYRPGERVSLRLDTAAVWRRLEERGFPDAGVRLWLPSVPVTLRPTAPPDLGSRAWRLRKGTTPPVVQVTMRPQAMRWGGAMALPVVGAVGVALAFFARWRRLSLPGASLAVAAAFVTVVTSAGRQGDNLGVAGLASGRALEAATIAPLAALPPALPAAMVLAVTLHRLARGRRRSGHPETLPGRNGAFW
ncbi:hypothetical protein [Actinomadura kijaniata]|uniref:hypothetical protein n=1 Tax=Actinomadura kijaniata TaxID=46161 RepID=UPI000A887E49|nr:hypothetical protein [Actinomadura kijaniata]